MRHASNQGESIMLVQHYSLWTLWWQQWILQSNSFWATLMIPLRTKSVDISNRYEIRKIYVFKGIRCFEDWNLNSKWALTYVMYIHTVPIYHRLAWLLWGMCLWNLTAAIRESTLMPHWLWPHFFLQGIRMTFLQFWDDLASLEK